MPRIRGAGNPITYSDDNPIDVPIKNVSKFPAGREYFHLYVLSVPAEPVFFKPGPKKFRSRKLRE